MFQNARFNLHPTTYNIFIRNCDTLHLRRTYICGSPPNNPQPSRFSLPPVILLPILSFCFCVILWLRRDVMVTAVLLLAITGTPALHCLPQFPSDQGVPLPPHLLPQTAPASRPRVPFWAFWATKSFRMCQLLIQLQLWTEV